MIIFVGVLTGIGMLLTLATLFMGMLGLASGRDGMKSNNLMRWRVTLQAATLLMFALLVYLLRNQGH